MVLKIRLTIFVRRGVLSEENPAKRKAQRIREIRAISRSPGHAEPAPQASVIDTRHKISPLFSKHPVFKGFRMEIQRICPRYSHWKT
jgi:hypothetical protein